MDSVPLLDQKLDVKVEVESDIMDDGLLKIQRRDDDGRRPQWQDGLRSGLWSFVGSFLGLVLAIYITGGPAGLPLPQRMQPWLKPSSPQEMYDGHTVLATGADQDYTWKCIPPPPPFLLDDPRIASHRLVKTALMNIHLMLETNAAAYKDAVSISIVHSSKGKIYEFHSGRNRLNESASASPALVNGDSIFRIASITKTFVVLEALALGRQAELKGFSPELTLETRLQDVLPEFKLPPGYETEAAGITLGQLGSHRAGIGRDIGEIVIDTLLDIKYPPEGPGLLDDFPRNMSKKELLKLISDNDLIWQVGETPSYSNTGFSLLGLAVKSYHDKLHKQTKSFNAIVTDDIFKPLEMDHTFLGPIPAEFRKHITVPGSKNLVDKVFPEVHDPAGGIYSTSNDLTKLLHKVLLTQSPELITPSQRLTWLKSIHHFTDGITSVGIPWETFKAVLPDFSSYQIYFKGGGLPAQVSEISVLPEFGLGVVALATTALTDDELHKGHKSTDPLGLSFQIYNIILPALWEAYTAILISDYVGVYSSADGTARIRYKDGFLVLEYFQAKDTDVLLKWDQLIWSETGKRPRIFDVGAKLIGTAFEGKFRSSPVYGCAWGGFDAVTTKSGWGFDLFVIKKDTSGKMVLTYEPMGVKLYKVR